MKDIEMWHGDCLQLMRKIPAQSVDLFFCDLPYGVTHNRYDQAVFDLPAFWSLMVRCLSNKGTSACTGCQPFSSSLVTCGRSLFKYSLVWEKTMSVGFLNSKCRPLSAHEDILVFSKAGCNPMSKLRMTYNPQLGSGKPWSKKNNDHGYNYGSKPAPSASNSGIRRGSGGLPRSIIQVSNPNRNNIHPNQKPIELIQWIVKTYSNIGDLVVDPTAGGFTTAVAAHQTGRRAICIEKDAEYYQRGVERVRKAMAEPKKEEML